MRYHCTPSRTDKRANTLALQQFFLQLDKLSDAVLSQVEHLAKGRDILRRALEADLQKLNDSKAFIDGMVAGKPRVIVGGDAKALDLLVRVLGSGYQHLVAAQAARATRGLRR